MPPSYLILLWIHVLSAVAWIGGMLFLSLVLAPLVRSRSAVPEYAALFRAAALRFRAVVWTSIVALFSTGPLLLEVRGWSVLDPARWPGILDIKLGLVALLLILTLSHDLVLGPWISRGVAMSSAARTSGSMALFRLAAWVPRLALLVALVALGTALLLART